jgi:Carboxypeptidase regulatory-like domain
MKKALMITGMALVLLVGRSLAADKSLHDPLNPIDPELVSGSVRHSGKDKPLKDVLITVFDESNIKNRTLFTGEEGVFGLSSLRPGTYKIVFQKDGFRKVVREKVTVKTDAGIRLDIEMEETPQDLGPSPFHFFKH